MTSVVLLMALALVAARNNLMKRGTQVIIFCSGCIILYFVAKNLIHTRTVPSLDEFIAQKASTSNATTSIALNGVVVIHAPQADILASLAQTPAARQQGLSGVKGLPEKTGMLFKFETAGIYGFWMKDMNFPLDMVWIDSGKKVVAISENISTSTFPTSFYPPSPAMYVLEINARAAKNFGMATGTVLSF